MLRISLFGFNSLLKNQITKFSTKKETVKHSAESKSILIPSELKNSGANRSPRENYIVTEEQATEIVNRIEKYRKSVPFHEINVGIGMLTKSLIDAKWRNLVLHEKSEYFQNILKEKLQTDLNNGTVKFSEKYLQLESASSRKWDEQIIGQAYTSLSSTEFISCLSRSIISQSGIFENGRIEFFITIDPNDYISLTSGPDTSYFLYQTRSCIFQIFFDFELIDKVERRHFWPYRKQDYSRMEKNIIKDSDYYYLARIVPRQDLFEYFENTNLKTFSYFVIQMFSKRHAYVISRLEKWIPNCGARLICNREKSIPSELMNDSIDVTRLPQFSHPCRKLTVCDHYPNIHTFTKCGQLTPYQLLSLFNTFRHFPDYTTSGFSELASDFHDKIIEPDMEDPRKKTLRRF